MSTPVYIVKASFRLPSASNWQDLSRIKTSSDTPISKIDSDFWLSRNIITPDSDDNIYGGVVQNPFFADLSDLGIGLNEWSCLDPQQRLCLSLAQEITTDITLPQDTSVFIGASDTGWSFCNTLESDNRYLLAGSHLSMTSARISYHFDFTGKSKTIDTSCSSSLVAMSEAFEAISSGECDFSICGGVNLFNDPFKFLQLRRMKMLSPDHMCFTFKHNANGYVRSEGGILFLLASENCLSKYSLVPLAQVNGSFVNHDGLSAGITAPSLESQISLLERSLSASGLHCSNIGYIECHGTGTPLGDPIELKALNNVFNNNPVLVGSIKSKFGHLEAAAGAAGVLNCLSALQDHQLVRVDSSPATNKFSFSDSHLKHSNDSSLYFAKPTSDQSMLVSSFGFSGTNASLILSPTSVHQSRSDLKVALFPGQGLFDKEIGLQDYQASITYQQIVDSYWSQLISVLEDYPVDLPLQFCDRSSSLSPLDQQYLYLVHMLSLYDISISSGAVYDYLIGYSFGEYPASVAGSALTFDACVLALYEREKIVATNRGLFHLYYILKSNLTSDLISKYLPKEVIRCSSSSSIYAISSSFFEQVSSLDSAVIKYVGVDYCYHSSILVDHSCLSDSFCDIKLDLSHTHFLPSWSIVSPPCDTSWSTHFLNPIHFNDLLSRLSSFSSSLSFVEISTKPTLKRIVSQNLNDNFKYSSISIATAISSAQPPNFNVSSPVDDSNSISLFIISFISQCSGLAESSIDLSKTFTRCGLDSLELAQLVSKLSSIYSVHFSLEELVGDFHVINDAICEALRRSSSISNLGRDVVANSTSPDLIPSLDESNHSVVAKPESKDLNLKYSRAEIVHSVELKSRLVDKLKESSSVRNSISSLADPRYSAGYSPLYRDIQVPVVADSASGSHIFTKDGHQFLDFTMGFGVQLFGHNPPFLKGSLLSAFQNNSLFIGPQSSLASVNSKLLCELTCHERSVFCNTGTEAVMTAARLSRAYTSRDKILIFNGSYHGHNDFTLAAQSDVDGRTSPSSFGTPSSFLTDTLIVDYHDLDSIHRIVHQHHSDLAAIIVEPIQSRKPSVDVVKTLLLLRKLCDQFKIILIYDEVLIGFRCHYQSTYGYFGVKSDLSTYGKIIGGGLPIGAVAGDSRLLNLIDGGSWYQSNNDPSSKRVFFAGTFNKNPLTMISCHEVLSYFLSDKGYIQVKLNNLTRRLCTRLNQFFVARDVNIRVSYASSVFRFVGAPLAFYFELLSRNIYIWEGRTLFLSASHTVSDIDYFIESVESSVNSLLLAGVLDSSSFQAPISYLLDTNQLSLCAAYMKLPIEAQSFNQTVTLSNFTCIDFPVFLGKALSQISLETSLFGIYDLISARFSPIDSSDSDWVRYYADDSLIIQEFNPSNSCHVQCNVIVKNNQICQVHFCFAHYAIDGKGINDLFLRIFNGVDTQPISLSLSSPTVDITDQLLPLLRKEHFNNLQRGSSIIRKQFPLSSVIRDQLVYISEKYNISLPSLILAFYINALQFSLNIKCLIITIFGTQTLVPSDAYLYNSFVSPLPLIISSFIDFNDDDFSSLQTSLSKLVFNSSVDSSSLAKHFDIHSSTLHYPLSSFAFNFDRVSPVFSNSDIDVSFNDYPPSVCRWNCFLNVTDNSDSLILSIDYNPSLFSASAIDDVISHFYRVLDLFPAFPPEFSPFLQVCTAPSHTYSNLPDKFSPHYYLASLTSDFSNHSIRSCSSSISCRELHTFINEYSQDLSRYQDPIFCIRSDDIVFQLLLILTCWNVGRPYILWNPLESDEINFSRLSTCGVRSVISLKNDSLCVDLLPFDSHDIFFPKSFTNLAHLIFTSGSTGNPKAVPVSIDHLSSYQDAIVDRLTISQDHNSYRFGVISSLNFDFPFTTILLWLRTGGEIFLADYNAVKSPQFWLNIDDSFFSFLKILPPYFTALLEFVPIQKLIPSDILLFGGDALQNQLALRCYSASDRLRIFTHYGPTETCIGCSTFLVPRDCSTSGIVPVGQCLAGYEVSIEAISSDSFSRDLTSNISQNIGLIIIHTNNTYGKYFDGTVEPFHLSDNCYSYSTGDIGFVEDGDLTVLGRISGFLKINGYRVFLSDISNRISLLFPDLSFHLLPLLDLVSGSHRGDNFVLFYVDSTVVTNLIYQTLHESLPSYFCPSRIISLNEFPLTTNGKLDISALTELLNTDNFSSDSSNLDPYSVSDPSSSFFLSHFQPLFPGLDISLDCNFYQLGGDSLLAIRLSASFLRSDINVSADTILLTPDFKDLYQAFLAASPSSPSLLQPSTYYHLTPSQCYTQHYFDISNWFFTVLIDCTGCSNFVDDLSSLLSLSNFNSFSLSSSGSLDLFDSCPILISDHIFTSFDSFNSQLRCLADTCILNLNSKISANVSITRIFLQDDESTLCLCAFPHYLIDFISLQLLLDSVSSSAIDVIYPLGFSPTFKTPIDFPFHLQAIQDCETLLVATSDFRSSFLPTSFLLLEEIVTLPFALQSSRFLPFLIKAVSLSFADHSVNFPLLDLEFASRDYKDTNLSNSLGYFSIHLPCFFPQSDIDSISSRLRDIQENSSNIFSYLASNPDSVSKLPICSINCIDNFNCETSTGVSIIDHSLSSSESYPLAWSPFMIESTISSSNISLKLYYDNDAVTSVMVQRFLFYLQSLIDDQKALLSSDTTDIMNRLGW